MKRLLLFCVVLLTLSGCRNPQAGLLFTKEAPDIFPDYQFVHIPWNIAPLNFIINNQGNKAIVLIEGPEATLRVKSDMKVQFPLRKWKKFLLKNKGKTLEVKLRLKQEKSWVEYPAFEWYVTREAVDPYLVYQRIRPTPTVWANQGIYQRNLENFDEDCLLDNSFTDADGLNSFAFCAGRPDRLLFHKRRPSSQTYLLLNGEKTELSQQSISHMAYPAWHPSGNFVAFAINHSDLPFYGNIGLPAQLYNPASDILVYDVVNKQLITGSELISKDSYETFPAFSADGRSLYFCTATQTESTQKGDISYDLCRLDFYPEDRRFGSRVDTLVRAERIGRSISFPKPSPDGRFILLTLHSGGRFNLWGQDSDLFYYLLKDELHGVKSCYASNSQYAEDYASWSSNGAGFVFGSRRLNGLSSQLYLSYIDEKERPRKAVLLPIKDPDSYRNPDQISCHLPELLLRKAFRME
jgi:hypothetical protein